MTTYATNNKTDVKQAKTYNQGYLATLTVITNTVDDKFLALKQV